MQKNLCSKLLTLITSITLVVSSALSFSTNATAATAWAVSQIQPGDILYGGDTVYLDNSAVTSGKTNFVIFYFDSAADYEQALAHNNVAAVYGPSEVNNHTDTMGNDSTSTVRNSANGWYVAQKSEINDDGGNGYGLAVYPASASTSDNSSSSNNSSSSDNNSSATTSVSDFVA